MYIPQQTKDGRANHEDEVITRLSTSSIGFFWQTETSPYNGSLHTGLRMWVLCEIQLLAEGSAERLLLLSDVYHPLLQLSSGSGLCNVDLKLHQQVICSGDQQVYHGSACGRD